MSESNANEMMRSPSVQFVPKLVFRLVLVLVIVAIASSSSSSSHFLPPFRRFYSFSCTEETLQLHCPPKSTLIGIQEANYVPLAHYHEYDRRDEPLKNSSHKFNKFIACQNIRLHRHLSNSTSGFVSHLTRAQEAAIGIPSRLTTLSGGPQSLARRTIIPNLVSLIPPNENNVTEEELYDGNGNEIEGEDEEEGELGELNPDDTAKDLLYYYIKKRRRNSQSECAMTAKSSQALQEAFREVLTANCRSRHTCSFRINKPVKAQPINGRNGLTNSKKKGDLSYSEEKDESLQICPNMDYYAEVSYECLPKHTKIQYGCVGDRMNLRCPRVEERLLIRDMSIGTFYNNGIREFTYKCEEIPRKSFPRVLAAIKKYNTSQILYSHCDREPDGTDPNDGHSSVTRSTSRRFYVACTRKQNCSVYVDMEALGYPKCYSDPQASNQKFLKVTYSCVSVDTLSQIMERPPEEGSEVTDPSNRTQSPTTNPLPPHSDMKEIDEPPYLKGGFGPNFFWPTSQPPFIGPTRPTKANVGNVDCNGGSSTAGLMPKDTKDCWVLVVLFSLLSLFLVLLILSCRCYCQRNSYKRKVRNLEEELKTFSPRTASMSATPLHEPPFVSHCMGDLSPIASPSSRSSNQSPTSVKPLMEETQTTNSNRRSQVKTSTPKSGGENAEEANVLMGKLSFGNVDLDERPFLIRSNCCGCQYCNAHQYQFRNLTLQSKSPSNNNEDDGDREHASSSRSKNKLTPSWTTAPPITPLTLEAVHIPPPPRRSNLLFCRNISLPLPHSETNHVQYLSSSINPLRSIGSHRHQGHQYHPHLIHGHAIVHNNNDKSIPIPRTGQRSSSISIPSSSQLLAQSIPMSNSQSPLSFRTYETVSPDPHHPPPLPSPPLPLQPITRNSTVFPYIDESSQEEHSEHSEHHPPDTGDNSQLAIERNSQMISSDSTISDETAQYRELDEMLRSLAAYLDTDNPETELIPNTSDP